MRDVTLGNFGFLVAYVLPGFGVLWAASFHSPAVRTWLLVTNESPTIGGFAYATLAAVALGLVTSTVRWLVLDTLHHATGIAVPQWDFRNVDRSFRTFQLLVDSHYRYYQFYGNSLLALILAYGAWRLSAIGGSFGYLDLLAFLVGVVLFAGSRDTLRKYYERGEAALRE